ncbi:MAG TPA: hypothetical protein VJ840_04850 [Gemmatimonadaceae bacterium]|nr:hypothetical protein [Gemmatimonadaceae bacterium]
MRKAACFAALCCAVCALPAVGQENEHDREDVQAREEYFWAQRSFPSSERPYELMQRAMAAASAQRQGRFNVMLSAMVPGGWRSIGPTGVFMYDNGYFSSGPMLDAGRLTAVAPTTNGTIYIGTASGGVWRSSAGGAWVPLTDNQCNLSVGAVTVDAADPNVVYAGTGEYNTNHWGCGILRSTDGGTTWTQLGATSFRVTLNGVPNGSASFSRIVVSRPPGGTVSNTVIIGATNVGVYRSIDGGATWSIVLRGATAGLVAHPTRAGVLFAGNSDNFTPGTRGLYVSSDNGATWSQRPAIPTNAEDIQRIELAISPAAPDKVIALVGGRNRKFVGLFVWNDVAGTWETLPAAGLYTQENRGDFGAQTNYDLALAVDPRDANRIYMAGVRAFRSTDGGATFAPIGMEIHCDWHSIVIDPVNPDILYAGTDGGAFVSTDAGNNWTSRSAGLAIAQYYPGISASPNGSVVMGGSQDNGTHLFTGSNVWNGLLGGDGGYTAINPADPSIRYLETQWGAFGPDLWRIQGTSYTRRINGIVADDRHAFIPPYVIDPVVPTRLYFGSHRLYKTSDEGANWLPVSGDLTRGDGFITAIAVAKADPNTIYVGASDGQLSVTRDGGATFTTLVNGLPTRWITSIAVDPTDATHALLTVSGFTTGHAFETKNAGLLWTDISGGLIDAPANAIAFVPGIGLMIGTDVGVFQTSAPGTAWSAAPPGIPNAIVYDLIYVAGANMVLAGTYGRGMFAYYVGGEPAVLRGDVNVDGKVDAFDALLIQQALVGSVPSGVVIYPRGDADCNQSVQTADAVFVLRTAVGTASPGVCVNTVR